ncbi:MAG: hypothetical protein KAT15_05765, partial [Bacteroidales bacterium]|nr:hypothetical protein [Bacteroidales bacterium]
MITGKVLGRQYIINRRTADVAGFTPDMSADIYYEVVRLMDRKFLFLDDHLERLQHSLAGSGLQYPGKDSIIDCLRLLQLNNDETIGNIRICIQDKTGHDADLLCYYVPY